MHKEEEEEEKARESTVIKKKNRKETKTMIKRIYNSRKRNLNKKRN